MAEPHHPLLPPLQFKIERWPDRKNGKPYGSRHFYFWHESWRPCASRSAQCQSKSEIAYAMGLTDYNPRGKKPRLNTAIPPPPRAPSPPPSPPPSPRASPSPASSPSSSSAWESSDDPDFYCYDDPAFLGRNYRTNYTGPSMRTRKRTRSRCVDGPVNDIDDACGVFEINAWSITSAVVKKRYRDLALMWHPDKNNTAHAKAMMQRINAAYTILMEAVM